MYLVVLGFPSPTFTFFFKAAKTPASPLSRAFVLVSDEIDALDDELEERLVDKVEDEEEALAWFSLLRTF